MDLTFTGSPGLEIILNLLFLAVGAGVIVGPIVGLLYGLKQQKNWLIVLCSGVLGMLLCAGLLLGLLFYSLSQSSWGF